MVSRVSWLLAILVASVEVSLILGQEWIPPPHARINQPGEPTYIHTPGDGVYNYTRYVVEDRRYFVFEVKACYGALLGFGSYVNGEITNVIEIALGTELNTRSEIRVLPRSPSSQPFFSTYTPDVIHCNEYRFFWVRWGGSNIQFGRGPVANEQTMMEWRDPQGRYFTSIGLTSEEGSAAVWKVSENSGTHQFFHSFGNDHYSTIWKSVMDKNFWVFSALPTAGQVQLLLSERLGSVEGKVYEFVLGSGTAYNRVFLRTAASGGSGTIVYDVTMDNVVNSTHYKEFWVSWYQGQVELGRGGLYGQNRLVLYKDPQPINVRYLSLTSSSGSYVRYAFIDDQENMNYIFTPPSDSSPPPSSNLYSDTWIMTPRQELFKFGLVTCREARILLSSEMSPIAGVSLELIIGAELNTKTILRRLGSTTNLAEESTPNVLSCEESLNFWLSWHNNTIQVGAHYSYSGVGFLKYTIPDAGGQNAFFVGALSLATPTSPGQWRVAGSVGERVLISTSTVYNHFDRYWRTVNQQKYMLFRVRACSDCHIALSPFTGVDPTQPYYDLVIGGYTNSYTLLERITGSQRDRISNLEPTPGILNCNRHVDLWVSWDNGQVSMGRGVLPHFHVMFTWNMTTGGSFPMKAVGFSTGFGTGTNDGDFIVDEDTSDYFLFYTSIYDSIRWLELEPVVTWLPIRVRACEQVFMFLCSSSNMNNCYTLTLANNVSSLTGVGLPPASLDSPDTLHCLDSRNFWIRWRLGRVEVGHGTIPGATNTTFLGVSDSNPISVTFIGFRSSEGDTYARWQVDKSAVKAIGFQTPVTHSYEQMWEMVERSRAVIFGVQACSDVHVVLSNRLRWFNDVFDLFIGGSHNTRSAIRAYPVYRDDYTNVATPSILSCNELRYFWVTWQYGAIEVGRGEIVGRDKFMDYQPLDLFPVSAVGYSTGWDYNGTWYIKVAGSLRPTESPVTPVTPTTRPPLGNPSSMSSETTVGIILGVLSALLLALLVVLYIRARGSVGAKGATPGPSG